MGSNNSIFNKKLLAAAIGATALGGFASQASAEVNLCDNPSGSACDDGGLGGFGDQTATSDLNNILDYDLFIVGANNGDSAVSSVTSSTTFTEAAWFDSDAIPSDILSDGTFAGGTIASGITNWTREQITTETSEYITTETSVVEFDEDFTQWDYGSGFSDTFLTETSDIWRVYTPQIPGGSEAFEDYSTASDFEVSEWADTASTTVINEDGFFTAAADTYVSDGQLIDDTLGTFHATANGTFALALDNVNSDVSVFDQNADSIFAGVSDFGTGDSSTLELTAHSAELSQNGHGLYIASDVTTLTGGVTSTNVTLTDSDVSIGVDGDQELVVTSDLVTVDADLAVTGDTDLDGTLDVSDVATFQSDVNVAGDLDVDGETSLDNTTIDGTLGVSDVATFQSDIVVNGNADLNGDLDVDGQTSLDNTTIDGTLGVSDVATFQSDVVVNGNADLNGDLDVDGQTSLDNTTIDGTLGVSDVATFQSDIVVNGNADLNGDLDVDGQTSLDNTTIDGTLGVSDVATFQSDVVVNGDADLNGDLDVDGYTTLDGVTNDGVLVNNGDVDVNGNADISGTLAVHDDATFASDVQVDNNLNVDGFTSLDNTDIDGYLDVNGSAEISGDLDMDGDGTITTGDITIDGGTNTITVGTSTTTIQDGLVTVDGVGVGSFGGTTTIDGGNINADDLSLDDDLYVADDADIDGDLDVDGHTYLDNTDVDGYLDVNGSGDVSGDWTVGDDLFVNDDATVYGDLTVWGESTHNSGIFVEDNLGSPSTVTVTYGTDYSTVGTSGLGYTVPDSGSTSGETSSITRQIDLLPNWEGTEVQTTTTELVWDETVNELVVDEDGFETTVGMADISTTTVVTDTTIRNDFDQNDDFVNDTQETQSVTTTYNENVMVSYIDQNHGTIMLSVDNYTDNRVVTDGSTISGSLDQTQGSLYLGKTETSLSFNETAITITDDNVDFSGAVLSGVADGVANNDAANVGQLNTAINNLSNQLNSDLDAFQVDVNGQLSDIRSDLSRTEEKLSKGIAASNALEVFMPDPGKKFRANVAAGHYNGETALGVTGAGNVNENVAVFFGVSTDIDGDEAGGKVGVSYQW